MARRPAQQVDIMELIQGGALPAGAEPAGEDLVEKHALVAEIVAVPERAAEAAAVAALSAGASAAPAPAPASGLRVERRQTRAGVDPFDEVEWELRDASISGAGGETVFAQQGVEFPKRWSQLATNVVVNKYFRGAVGSPEREFSVRQLIGRVVDTIADWGLADGYFASPEDGEAFRDELKHLLLHQKASFNSPVWFNCGIEAQPQVSACFINSVEDSMSAILQLAHTEAMLFKYGSGAGVNLSSLRSSRELLRGGGTASGPVSFMRGFDAFAGVIKSGGKTRRAAKMVVLNDSHPDVLAFAGAKEHEERKAWALIDAGYDGSFNGEAYGSVFFQNANHSVRVTDDFMYAVERDGSWTTRSVTTGEAVESFPARDLMHTIARGTHVCGDPGMQFDTTVNEWHTCPNSGRINASNPCSEFMFLDNSACNLASLNLRRFVGEDGELDIPAFRHAVDLLITAQEIVVDRASYPTAEIGANSVRYRPLGLGYANLGALLMERGLAYDSEEGRAHAAAITALMTGQAYATSARLAQVKGPFAAFEDNRQPFLRVMRKHRAAVAGIDASLLPAGLVRAAREAWDEAIVEGERGGYRNAQTTLLAPTGTIAFMMDCDTTGIEPDIALVKYKQLVGGGQLKIVNNTVAPALARLGYGEEDIRAILGYIGEMDTIEGAPGLRDEHLSVFDCAFRPLRGERSIQYMGHIRMMGAVQPFLSGAISKTVNMPESATVEEIEHAYRESWRQGLKAVAIYRDNSKRTQPLRLEESDRKPDVIVSASPAPHVPFPAQRRRLPDERQAITHKFSVGGHEGYITVGVYEDGKPGEIFVTMAKQGSVVNGLMDSFATSISMALQYGVPLEVLARKFCHTRFEPSGFTKNPRIPMAKSIMDYIFRWLESRFLTGEQLSLLDLGSGPAHVEEESVATVSGEPEELELPGTDVAGRMFFLNQQDSPACPDCGSITVRNGACYKCMNCGATTGCS